MPRKKETIVDVVAETKVVETKSTIKQTATDETVKTTKATKVTKIQSPSLTIKPTTATKVIASKPKKQVQPKPKTITRIELAQEVAKVVGQYMEISNRNADMIVSEIINSIIDSLKEGNRVEIRGFGAFRVRTRSASRGHNPKTGAPVEVPSKNVVYFKIGKDLKQRLLKLN